MASIYVGNVAFGVTENELQAAFEEYGQVSSVNIIKDRETGRSRGFAFVEMPDGQEAKQAIEALNLSRSVAVTSPSMRPEGREGPAFIGAFAGATDQIRPAFRAVHRRNAGRATPPAPSG